MVDCNANRQAFLGGSLAAALGVVFPEFMGGLSAQAAEVPWFQEGLVEPGQGFGLLSRSASSVPSPVIDIVDGVTVAEGFVADGTRIRRRAESVGEGVYAVTAEVLSESGAVESSVEMTWELDGPSSAVLAGFASNGKSMELVDSAQPMATCPPGMVYGRICTALSFDAYACCAACAFTGPGLAIPCFLALCMPCYYKKCTSWKWTCMYPR